MWSQVKIGVQGEVTQSQRDVTLVPVLLRHDGAGQAEGVATSGRA